MMIFLSVTSPYHAKTMLAIREMLLILDTATGGKYIVYHGYLIWERHARN